MHAAPPGLPDGLFNNFQTKKSELWVNFGVVLQWKMLVYICILWTFGQFLRTLGRFYGHLVYFVVIWYMFPVFGNVLPRKIWQPCAAHV
jgi:hypothetical protein